MSCRVIQMDIQDYLKKQRGRLRQQTQRVKDSRVFDYSYVPEQPLIRPQTKAVLDALLRFDLTGVPTNLLILGSRGSGKTLTLKHLCQMLPGQTALVMHYVNCRHHNTSHRILAEALGGRCQGMSLGSLYERFIESHRGKRLVLVLDEVDLMSAKDKRREVLYLLSRAETPVMLILLSNHHGIADQLDASTRSSLQLSTLHFPNYNPVQITEILRTRAEQGLTEWQHEYLTEIAARTVNQTHADARVAIKTLYVLITRTYEPPGALEGPPRDDATDDTVDSEKNTSPKHKNSRESAPEPSLLSPVEAAFEYARRDILLAMVNDLNNALLLILWAVVTGSSSLAKDVFERYSRFSRERHEPPFSYVHYYASLAYLQSCGLVALVSTKLGRAYTNRVVPTFDGRVVEPVVETRFA